MPSNHAFNLSMYILYFYIIDILLYKNTNPNPVYPGEFLHINNQRAHNNYENIILKESNENSPKSPFGPAGPVMDNTARKCTVFRILHRIHY